MNTFRPRQLIFNVSDDPSPKPKSQDYKHKNVAPPSGLSSVIRSSTKGKKPNLRKQSKIKKEFTEVDITRVYSNLDKFIAEEKKRKAKEIESQRNGRPLHITEVFGKKKREPDSDSVKLSEDPETDSDDEKSQQQCLEDGYETEESQRQCWEDGIIQGYE